MGTDVAWLLERRRNGRWEALPEATPNEPSLEFEDPASEAAFHEYVMLIRDGHPGLPPRDYNLFGLLAGVQNHFVLDLQTGRQGYVPIAPGRGIPADVSPDGWTFMLADKDDFGHTWLTLDEVTDVDWSVKRVRTNAGVSLDEYQDLRVKGGPPVTSPTRSVHGQRGRPLTMAQADVLLDGREPGEPGAEFAVDYWWDETYRDALAFFLETSVTYWLSFAEEAQDLRLLMTFNR